MPRFRRCRESGCHAMVQLPNHYCTKHFEHEAEYLENRQRWARSHSSRYQHKYNHVTRNRTKSKSDQYKFYHTRTWSSLRKQVLERDHYICQYCHKTNSRTVDHIVPIECDSTRKADIANLVTICRQCHRLKTDWEQQYYGTGQDNQLKDAELVTDLLTIRRLMNTKSDD